MIRVLIVHQTKLIASLLANVLNEEEDIYVAAQAHSEKEALQKLDTAHCQIVLVAATLPDNGALNLTKTITNRAPETKVLVYGTPESKNIILQYVMAGAKGYVLQEVSTEELLQNIRAVSKDKTIVSPQIAAAMMEHIAEMSRLSAGVDLSPASYEKLTPREHEVLSLIVEDLSNKEIADRLYIEVGTVKNHVHSILQKLDVASREDAAAHWPFIENDQKS